MLVAARRVFFKIDSQKPSSVEARYALKGLVLLGDRTFGGMDSTIARLFSLAPVIKIDQ